MKLFLIWPGGKEVKVFYDQMISAGHEVVYWVGTNDLKELIPVKVFHDHYEALEGKPAFGVREESFLPPGKDLLKELSNTESIVLTMMNKHFDGVCVDQRKYFYYEMVRYWDGVLKLYKPDAVLFPIVPHTVYNYVLYALAKKYGIKTLMFEDTWVSDRALLYKDYEIGSDLLHINLKKNQGKVFSDNDLSPDLKDYYHKQIAYDTDKTPIYMKVQIDEVKSGKFLGLPFKGLIRSIKKGYFLTALKIYFKKNIFSNLGREYKSFQKDPDLDKPFVYMPMSFQPERTSSPQSGVFASQLLAIRIMASSLPKGWELYVKEHPSQWMLRTKEAYSSARWKGYYEAISKIPNVILVPIISDTFKLIEKSRAVSVMAGSAGWEALIREKPVINFGLPWYHDFEGVFTVNDANSCHDAMDKIVKGFKVDKGMMLRNLKSLDESSVHGYIESQVSFQSELSQEESISNLIKMIIDELSKK